MRVEDKNIIFFLGIGGIGMSALARYFNQMGKKVGGYDKTSTSLTDKLQEEGIYITFEDVEASLWKDADLIIYTPAIPSNSIQLNFYKNNNFPLFKRSKILGEIVNSSFCIAVSGSHGKTSTSCSTAYLLSQSGIDVAAFLGGVSVNFDSNYLSGNEYMIAEADEFDQSFLALTPNIAIVTSVDTDHLDIYGNYEAIKNAFAQFLKNVKPNGLIIANGNVPKEIFPEDREILTYSIISADTDYSVEFSNKVEVGTTIFDALTPTGRITNLKLKIGGKHNVENALAAIAVAKQLGVDDENIREALASYKGVKRRFEKVLESDSYVLFDDYAHHPQEIEATLNSVRALYPDWTIQVIFQPHLFSRTRDLAEGFGKALSIADKVYLIDIYPARELPIEGVTSKLIADFVESDLVYIGSKDKVLKQLQPTQKDVMITMGAGDIDSLLEELKKVKSLEQV
jgi:UDP-N-acetylmuramate--alanine ligase